MFDSSFINHSSSIALFPSLMITSNDVEADIQKENERHTKPFILPIALLNAAV